MKRSTILQSGRMLLALLLLAWASTNGWGQSEVNDEFIATDFVGEPGNYVEYKDFFDVPGLLELYMKVIWLALQVLRLFNCVHHLQVVLLSQRLAEIE